jgi:hypothetical protein
MSLLDRYERQATILPMRRLRAPEDLVAAAVDEKRTWKQIEAAIREGGDPTALTGGIAGLELTALTPVASATAAHWRCFGILYIRGGDTTGTAFGSFEMNHSGTTGGGGPVSATGNAIFGGVSASAVDFSAATALWMGVTHATSTTNTWTAQFVGWGSWN